MKLYTGASGVIIEYQLGNTSRRLGAMLTGQSLMSAESGHG